MEKIPQEINGWKITGANDVALLEADPGIFSASKADMNLKLHYNVIVERMTLASPPTEETPTSHEIPSMADWLLCFNGRFIARGRSLGQILEKTVRFMKEYE